MSLDEAAVLNEAAALNEAAVLNEAAALNEAEALNEAASLDKKEAGEQEVAELDGMIAHCSFCATTRSGGRMRSLSLALYCNAGLLVLVCDECICRVDDG